MTGARVAADRPAVAVLVRERRELHHVVCCNDDDFALCGKDVGAEPFTTGAGEQFCLVCQDLDDSLAEAEDPICPRTGRRCP